jgi:hypothetical protein
MLYSLNLSASVRRGNRQNYFCVREFLEDVMVSTGKVVPRQAETQETARLTKSRKAIGVCLLLFYLAMIVITVATLPYVANVASRTSFE